METPDRINRTVGDPAETPAPKNVITYQLSLLNSKLKRQATQILKSHSTFTLVQWRIVSIVEMAGESTFSELVELSGMDSGLVSRNIKAMIATGILHSEIDANDHRRATLRATAKGKRQHRAMLPIMQKRQKLLLEGVDGNDLEVFRRMITQLGERAENVDLQWEDSSIA